MEQQPKKNQYYENFCKNNEELIKTQQTCDICDGKFKYYNKSHHIRTSRHKNALKYKELYENKISQHNII